MSLPSRTDVCASTVHERSVLKLHQACRVYTREELAAGLLDAIGWRDDRELAGQRLLEPAAGGGVFLRLATERLIGSLRRHHHPITARTLAGVVTAYEIYPKAHFEAMSAVFETLVQGGLAPGDARKVAATWVRAGDFLTASEIGTFTHVVGNPPYVRWSNVPKSFRQLYDGVIPEAMLKGDLCVPFFYKSVCLLRPGGVLGFVCSDRWVRAQYGSGLRSYLGDNVKTVAYVELHNLPAFDRSVHAYAAVTILNRPNTEARHHVGTRFAQPTDLAQLNDCLRDVAFGSRTSAMARVDEPLSSRPAILIRDRSKVRMMRRLEARMPALNESGCTIRVGAALGHAPAFVVEQRESGVEAALLLPYATSRDVQDGRIHTSRWVIDVFDERGELINLCLYPGAREHLLRFKRRLSRRSCVRHPEQWYRTIDKISGEFAKLPKILICGIARSPRLAIAKQVVQPGNSLYAITSLEWPLAAVANVLSSGVLGLFADAYSCRVNGDFLRFHGMVLKKLRLPGWLTVPREIRGCLSEPESNSSLLKAVAGLYGTTEGLLAEYSATKAPIE